MPPRCCRRWSQRSRAGGCGPRGSRRASWRAATAPTPAYTPRSSSGSGASGPPLRLGRLGLVSHEEALELRGRHGRTEQETLQLLTSALAQELRLLQRLDALCDDAELE